MNIYQKVYLQDLITQENIKSLIPMVQLELLNFIGVNSYQELLPNDKILFQQKLNNKLKNIKEKVQSLTSNLQYQSWVYKILKQQDKEINEDYQIIHDALIDFAKLSKRSDLTPQQKNIQNYNHFQDLQAFILSFQKEHKLQSNIYQNLTKLYSNSMYTCYLIHALQFKECNKLFGGTEYFNTGWCVAKDPKYFKKYLKDYLDKFNGYIVFIQNITNKPYALLHYGSHQFKDTSDRTITDHNKEIIDCLYHINSNFQDYFDKKNQNTDLEEFTFDIFNIDHPNASYLLYYLSKNNIKYDQSNKIIDCNFNILRINQKLLDQHIFDNKIINCQRIRIQLDVTQLPNNFYIPNSIIDCSNMFAFTCIKILPNNFTIPESVINCTNMFQGCIFLTKLPENFTLPNSITNCAYMFDGCRSLMSLPHNFKLPNNLTDCTGMFKQCYSLTELPNNFILPNSLINCASMFIDCCNLIKLPINFIIPNSVQNCIGMFSLCTKLIDYPRNIKSLINKFGLSFIKNKFFKNCPVAKSF